MFKELLENLKKASLNFSVNTEFGGEIENVTTDLLPYEELVKIGKLWELKVKQYQKISDRKGNDEFFFLDIQFVDGDKKIAQKVGNVFDIFPVEPMC